MHLQDGKTFQPAASCSQMDEILILIIWILLITFNGGITIQSQISLLMQVDTVILLCVRFPPDFIFTWFQLRQTVRKY